MTRPGNSPSSRQSPAKPTMAASEKRSASLAASAAAERGRPYLHSLLAEVDPAKAGKLSPHDLKRLVRALEVHHLTGQRISELQAESRSVDVPFRTVLIGLVRDREEIYRRIDVRADEMLAAGLVEEVRRLREAGLDERLTAVQAHGYKEILGYLRGDYDYDEGVRLLADYFIDHYDSLLALAYPEREQPEVERGRAVGDGEHMW